MSTPKRELVSHAHQPAPAARTGEIVLARYELRRRLGAGGMGVVYLAWDEHLQREVAVKRIAVEHDPEARGEREALAAARLSHPAIVALYESGRDDEAVYLVSEIVRGHTLAALLRDGELSDRDAVRIGAALCAALEHAHARGVIHRDVKPSNILVPADPAAAGAVAKLADFGIARMADHDVLTRTGDIMGTLAYMAPEQARGEKLDGRADVYALGVVLYEALAGANPIRGGNPAATARRVGMRLPPLGRARRDLPGALCRAIDAAVQPEPSARARLAILREALSESIDLVADQRGPISFGPLDELSAATARDRTPARDRWEAAEDELVREEGGAPVRDCRTELAPEPRRGRRAERDDDGRRGRGRRVERGAALELEPDPHDGYARGAPDVTFHGSRRRELPGAEDPRRRGRHGEEHPRGFKANLPPRLAAAAGAAALAAAALAWLGPQPPLQPAAGAAGAALAVALLPRAGWLLTAGAIAGWLAIGSASGVALLLLVAAGPVVLMMPLSGTSWSLPALAPLLGAAGLAGAWPALAGQARRWPDRAALGALGGWWVGIAEALTSKQLVLGPAHDAGARGAWEGSAVDAARDALWPLLTGGALALAVLWALAALALPLLVRGRSAALDIVGAAGWAAAVAAATQAIAGALVLDPPRGLVAGAIVAAVVAVAARAVRGRA